MRELSRFIPTTMGEAESRGIKRFDVILITGDAYVDHPSFGVSVVGRYLESLGITVGIISAPDLENDNDFLRLGSPRLFFGITAGNLDSMIMRYTANKKIRRDDNYLPGGEGGEELPPRPKRAVIAYAGKLRKLFDRPTIVAGGLEASLRRFAHYDYWDDKVRRSILLDGRIDLLLYGMAERPLKELVQRLQNGESFESIDNIRGSAKIVNADIAENDLKTDGRKALPSYERVSKNKKAYTLASKIIHKNQNPDNADILYQKHAGRFVKINRPAFPLDTKTLDSIFDLPFARLPHPSYKKPIPAFEMIKNSITAMRGCFGGCSFCALTVHQGKTIQSRSSDSIVREGKRIAQTEGFKGYISDVGGPTANMYRLYCGDRTAEKNCRKLSCVHPKICSRLACDHKPLIEMLKQVRAIDKVKKVFIASGVRYDLAILSPEYIKELAVNHTSGQLKVAPEHSAPGVLKIMRKPPLDNYEKFTRIFREESAKAGLEQYLVPYFISSHPGCDTNEQIDLALYLKKNGIRPRQVQDFIPAPMTLAGDIYHTGIDPMSGEEVFVEKTEKGRAEQRALMQYFKPENSVKVQMALKKSGREKLAGYGKEALIKPLRRDGGKNKNFTSYHK